MRKRLLIVTAALAALWAAPADCKASAFGLTYSRQCSSCGFCVRPYNAFSSVTCGVANVNYGPACCAGFPGLNPKCCGHGGLLGCRKGCCGHRGCGKRRLCGHKLFCCRLRGRVFGTEDYPIFPEEYEGDSGGYDDSGAFGSMGQEVPFYGVPAIPNGYNPGCHMGWAWNTPPVNVPGHTPPGVYVQPPNASCTNVWLPPQPVPGMYGIPAYPQYPQHPMAYYPQSPEPPQQQKPAAGGPAPAAYQQPQGGQGGYYVPASWWYPGYGAPQQWGWYPQAYYGQ